MGRRWGYDKLSRLKDKINSGLINDILLDFSTWDSNRISNNRIDSLPIDWIGFNKMYYSSCPVVIRSSSDDWLRWISALSFMYALKMSFHGKFVAMYSSDGYGGITDAMYKFYSILMKNKAYDKIRVIENVTNPSIVLDLMGQLYGYDWLFLVTHPDRVSDLLRVYDKTNGFSKDGSWHSCADTTIPNWGFKNSRVAILWNENVEKSSYEIFKSLNHNKFLFIEKPREYDLIDGWFKENDTMMDPILDIRLMEKGWDMRKLLSYAATNHLYKFREYAKFNPEIVGKFFTRNEIRELGAW